MVYEGRKGSHNASDDQSRNRPPSLFLCQDPAVVYKKSDEGTGARFGDSGWLKLNDPDCKCFEHNTMEPTSLP